MFGVAKVHRRRDWLSSVSIISLIFFGLLGVGGLSSCKKVPTVDEEHFEKILLDIQLAEAMVQSYPVDSHDIYRAMFVEEILDEHKMTREQYRAAYEHYSEDHEAFQRMQERLKKKIYDAEKIEDLNLVY